MNFIVFDLEATCWEDKSLEMVQETIEIGAVMLDEYGDVQGSFNRFIRPILHPNLSPFCTQLTSIDQVSINRADLFDYVIEDFKEWVGVFDEEEYLLCSWGGFDKKQLAQDCGLHELEADWLNHHINLKHQYHEHKRMKTYRGLKKVVEKEGFEFTGTYHRGISDAENLAKVFIKYIDIWQY